LQTDQTIKNQLILLISDDTFINRIYIQLYMNSHFECPVRRTIQRPARLTEYSTVDEFVQEQNNFYLHFYDGNFIGDAYRQREAFNRFNTLFPEQAKQLQVQVTQAVQQRKPLPYRDLFEAYWSMKQLVCEFDKCVQRNGVVDPEYLIR
jgi:hypothetical protein